MGNKTSDTEKPSRTGRRLREIEDEVRAKALRTAYEIAEDFQSFAKVKLKFEQFDKLYEKLRELSYNSYTSAIKAIFYAREDLK